MAFMVQFAIFALAMGSSIYVLWQTLLPALPQMKALLAAHAQDVGGEGASGLGYRISRGSARQFRTSTLRQNPSFVSARWRAAA